MLSFAQLTTPRTREEWLALLVQALKGVGFVKHTGNGSGAVSVAGTARTAADVDIEILTTGEPGAATFRYSLNDGSTWSGSIGIPAGGSYVLGATGVVVTFAAGPSGSGDSFIDGDLFEFELQLPTFQSTDWNEGSVGLTFLEVDAAALADRDEQAARFAAGGLIDEATGSWLDLIATSFYDLTRAPAVATKGTATLTDAASSGPHAITAGQLTATTAAGKRYWNSTGGVLALGGTLDLEWTAEESGSAYNVGTGEINELVTPLPGVTIANAPAWITTTGSDEETDVALRARCKGRWAELGLGATAEAYDSWARTATIALADRVTKTYVRVSPTVAGQVDVFLAGDAGASAGGTVTAANTYIQARIPLTSTCVVAAATNLAVTLTGTVIVEATKAAAAQSAAAAALIALFKAMPIGGYTLGGGSKGVSFEALLVAIAAQDGVQDVNLTGPVADTVLTATQVATLTNSLVWTPV